MSKSDGFDTRNDPVAGPVDDPAADYAALKLDEYLPNRLNICASIVSQALATIYAEQYKIGLPEWRVLVCLGAHGMMTAKEIGRHSHMHKTKVSRGRRARTPQADLPTRQSRGPARGLPVAHARRPRDL